MEKASVPRFRRPNDLAFAVIAWLVCATVQAGDWPQLLGPQGNGHSVGEEVADRWDKQKPSRIWSVDVGEGYAGPAVADGRVYVFHRQKESEILDCLSARDGKRMWRTQWPAIYRGGIDSDRGPRCVPLVRENRAFVFGAGGSLRCVDVADGQRIWDRHLGRELQAQDGYFGFGSSPILVGDTLLLNVGGKAGASIVGIDPATGRTRWTSLDDQASYSTPAVTSSGGRNLAIFVTRLNLVGLRPDDGGIMFQLPFGARGPTVNAATPIVLPGDRVFVTASYRIGAKCISLKDPRHPIVQWESDETLSSQYPTPVVHRGFLYGVHGREDGPPASLRCVDASSGRVRWSKEDTGMAHLIVADEKLLALTNRGELLLIRPTSERYEELGRVTVSHATTRALPAFSSGQLVFRDVQGTVSAWKLP